MKRYEALAADIKASIRNGTLKTGDRLPSVRHTGQSRGVRASTVFEAYYLLEARGLVRARDQSGYYVTGGGLRDAPPESTLTSRPAGGPGRST
ncbi:DNA-binding transcriptional regulator YhcF (GntR family) [Variovorax sp. 1133]